ncbi:MAG: NAD(P)-binding protein [Lachnospiraceae bacterium]|nr:NAD(P)-binding protein [Lachnospiraceae bacterium]
MDYDVLIAGAGLYGCVYAHEAAAMGKRVLVIDKRDHIAGNCYTKEVRGIHVHRYGAHIFHTSDRQVWEYVQRFARFNHYINSPVAIYRDELYNLPFNMNTFYRMWGTKTPAEAKAVIDEQRAEAASQLQAAAGDGLARNLEEQGLLLAGRDIFDRLIRGYTEKQWGRPCAELPAFIINRLPFRFTYDNNYFNDPYQGIPVDGYTALCARLLGQEESPGAGREAVSGRIDVRLRTAFEDFVVMKDGLPVRFADDGTQARRPCAGVYRTVTGDTVLRIVYTGRIDAFFAERLGAPEYRSLRFEEEDLPHVDNYQGNAVVNYTEREVPYTRIIEHKHFLFGAGEGTVITREYPDTYEEGKEPYYPVNDEKNNALYARYEELACEICPDILFGGRLGRYRYYNMDQVIRTALDDVKAGG